MVLGLARLYLVFCVDFADVLVISALDRLVLYLRSVAYSVRLKEFILLMDILDNGYVGRGRRVCYDLILKWLQLFTENVLVLLLPFFPCFHF